MANSSNSALPDSGPKSPVIVTGLSGAGMTSVLKAFEDMGYEVFDNFPLPLLDALIAETKADGMPVAVGIDSRTRGFEPGQLAEAVERMQAKLLFLFCDEATLQKRFTETRRRHPLAKDKPVSAGIKKEQEWLYPLRAGADMVLDTTDLSIHDLRHRLEKQYSLSRSGHLNITVMSFGFRYGVPRDADMVLDVRFLANPHWVKTLKPLTGLDEEVGAYVSGDPDFEAFITNLKNMLTPLLPRYTHEGKSYLTIAIGCTGGQHRSVYTVEKLGPWFVGLGYLTNVLHRDIKRATS